MALAITACQEGLPDIPMQDSLLKLSVISSETKGLVTDEYFPENTPIGVTLLNSEGNDYDAKQLGNLKFTSSGTNETQKWIGEKEVLLSANDATVYSYYPYSADITDITAMPVETASQTDYMWGTPVNGINTNNPLANVTMQHALSVVRLNIVKGTYAGTGNITKVSVASDALATKANLDTKTGALTITDDADRTISMDYTDKKLGDMMDIIVIPRGLESHFVITLEVDGRAFKTVTGNIALTAGKIAKIDLKVDENYTELIRTKISEWVVEEKGQFDNIPDEFENYLVANMNVTTLDEISILDEDLDIQKISEMYVDNIKVTPTKTYKFATRGNHQVALRFYDTILPYSLFSHNTYLTDVYIPNGMTEIKHYTFNGCKNLNKIIIPEGITKIGSNAFYNCSKLTSIELPSTLSSLEGSVFVETGLASITIPNGVKTIPHQAFFQCYDLTTVNLPKTITRIENRAFMWCGFTTIELPESITYIGTDAFRDCNNLETITIPSQITELSTDVFYSCSNLATINFPENLKKIGNSAFLGCAFTSLNIPESVEEISNAAFQSCKNLESINIPEKVTVIENKLFNGCEKLTSITLPKNIIKLGDGVFASTALNSIISLNPTAPSVGSHVFDTAVTVTVPTGATGYDAWVTAYPEFVTIEYSDDLL